MAFISNASLDAALAYIRTNGTNLRLCTSEPATFAASTTAAVGNAAVSIGAPANRTPNGRRVTVPAITGGSITGDGTASHYAIVNVAGSELLATGSLTATQVVTTGNTFNTLAFDIGIPGAV